MPQQKLVLPRRRTDLPSRPTARYPTRLFAGSVDLLLALTPFLLGVVIELLAAYNRVRVLPDGRTISTTVVPMWARFSLVALGLSSIVVLVVDTVVMQGRTGRTVGKRLLHLRLEGSDASPVGVGIAFVRLTATIVAAVLVVPIIVDLLVPLGDPARRRLVDRLLDTRVVRDVVDLREPAPSEGTGRPARRRLAHA